MMPLCSSARRALRCFFTMLIPSIVTRPVLENTRSTFPSLPLSSPRRTRTVSPRVTGMVIRSTLAACRARFLAFVRSVFLYFSIRMSDDLRGQRHDLHVLLVAQLARDLRLLHRAVRQRVLDRDDHEIAEPGVAPPRSAKDADHEGALRARVVRDLDHRFLLDHGVTLLTVLTARVRRSRPRATACPSTAGGSP